MDTVKDFDFKRKKYMPVFPRATGKPTVYIDGYPSEDDEPMAATGFHGVQIRTFSDQLARYFNTESAVYIGIDSFIYYYEGDRTKFVAPDIYVVLGAEKYPERRSFYTWAEGVMPTVVFEFLSDSTAAQDRGTKLRQYLIDIGVAEYFIHQPEGDKPPEFHGWRRGPAGEIEGIPPDAEGGLFSHSLNLWLRWEDYIGNVRLLRPYLPDGTPITTSAEEAQLREEAQAHAQQAETRAQAEAEHRREAQVLAQTEAEHRREAETRAQTEAEHRREAELAAQRAETRAQQAELELERLRAQLAASQDEG
jgi:Uma2 family endonuclease